MNERGTNWDTHLVAAELADNTSPHSTTGLSPIEIDIGVIARMPVNLSLPERDTSMSEIEILDQINVNEMLAFRAILQAQERDDQRVNASRINERYQIGDIFWLDTTDLFIMHEPGSKKLRPRWTGPFEVVRVEGDLNVELKLPDHWRIHPVVHIARLKRAYHRDERFEVDSTSDDQLVSDEKEPHDLSGYSERGAAVAQLDREQHLNVRPRTRSAVQGVHDRGERYDFLELRDAHDERRQRDHQRNATRDLSK